MIKKSAKSIAIIPARGGSKRIPRKNIKNFLGKPIIAYSIESALESCVFDEVMVSTDDAEIAEIAKHFGANVPFFRSKAMSLDMAMTVPVLIEVIKEYEKRDIEFKYCCCLYPCAPFVNSQLLKDSMHILMKSNETDSVVSVVRFSYPPLRGLVLRKGVLQMLFPENYDVRSQDLEPVYHDAGQFYCIRVSNLLKEQKLFCQNTFPIELPEIETQDIDTMDDWRLAEMKYKILHNIKN